MSHRFKFPGGGDGPPRLYSDMEDTMEKRIYFFGAGLTEGDASMKQKLGGKGANLAEMARMEFPVPPGFTIETTLCDIYHRNGRKWPEGLERELEDNLVKLEKAAGKKLGSADKPLLLSVRSGAAASMPGMMDTILNIGLNDEIVAAISSKIDNKRFPLDAYRRLMMMMGDVVMGVDRELFEEILSETKKKQGVKFDSELSAESLKTVVEKSKALFRTKVGKEFPQNPREQLKLAITAVFDSWNNPRAITYRQLNQIRNLLGTAVNVQAMVFGNRNENSGSGVGFTRDPSTGENKFFAEYLFNAQGEDVVAGVRTPLSIEELNKKSPDLYRQLNDIRNKLEQRYKDMQDIEFTVEDGKLFMLQTRTGKRTIFAHIKIAVDLVEAGIITKEEAVSRVPAGELGKLFAPELDPKAIKKAGDSALTRGLNASPGGASGKAVFSAEDAQRMVQANASEKVLLCRTETSPEDIGGMAVAQAVLTTRGGMTSHAAVVARGMGVPCVTGASEIVIDYAKKTLKAGKTTIKEGDWISINGFDGMIYKGKIEVIPSEIIRVLDGQLEASESRIYRDYSKFMGWADGIRRLKVRTNADKPADAKRAMQFGAEGIGLCRTEHMFFDNINPFRRLILVSEEVKRLKDQLAALQSSKSPEDADRAAKTSEELEHPLAEYNRALADLLPLQRADFEGIFTALNGKPANIRTLDPPLHEFLPKDKAGQDEMASELKVDLAYVQEKVESLAEANPMLGHRGCRLGLVYPEIHEMQVRAIMEAAVNIKRKGIEVRPEIMIPLVGKAKELELSGRQTVEVAEKVLKEAGMSKKDIPYQVGTMIEVPRAAVTADEIAEFADFFSFGTNDLTQMGCGFSRDDAGKFLDDYVKMGIYEEDPFKVLDVKGVGKLMKIGIELGRKAKPGLKIGICGEHGGEPQSVAFCHEAGLDYVSCSPYRVPVARLAAAQAALSTVNEDK